MKRLYFLLFTILLFTLATACGQEGPPARVQDEPVDEITDEERENVLPEPTAPPVQTGITILADGQVIAPNPVLSLSFDSSGKLLTLDVAAGDRVMAGEVIATLDDESLQETVTNAQLQVAQSENSLAQAQLSLDNLVNWEADETAVALAQANLAAAEASLAQTEETADVSGANLTSANVQINQAQRRLEDAQEAYDTAHDPGRDWELGDPWRADALKAERESTARFLVEAQEGLSVAYAQYNLSAANIDNETALKNAEAAVLSAQQSLEQATDGPMQSEVDAAQLQVTQAELALEQSQFALTQAQNALERAQLVAPISGTVLSVEVVDGATVGAGTPIVTILDTERLEFHTTNLSERDLGQVMAGNRAVVTLKAFPNTPIEATVDRIGLQSTGTVGDAAVFPVILSLEATDLEIRPGMTGRVDIETE